MSAYSFKKVVVRFMFETYISNLVKHELPIFLATLFLQIINVLNIFIRSSVV